MTCNSITQKLQIYKGIDPINPMIYGEKQSLEPRAQSIIKNIYQKGRNISCLSTKFRRHERIHLQDASFHDEYLRITKEREITQEERTSASRAHG